MCRRATHFWVTLSSIKWIVKSHISRRKRVKVETSQCDWFRFLMKWTKGNSDKRSGLEPLWNPCRRKTGKVSAFCVTHMFFSFVPNHSHEHSPFSWGILWKEVHSADAHSSHTSLIDGNNEGVGKELLRAVSIHNRPSHICPNSCLHSVFKTVCLTIHRPLHHSRGARMPNTDVQMLKTSTVNFVAA